MRAISETAPARLRERLAVAVAVDANGARAIVELERGKIASARARLSPGGAVIDARDQLLAQRLIGQDVTLEGAVCSAEEYPPLVVNFSAK